MPYRMILSIAVAAAMLACNKPVDPKPVPPTDNYKYSYAFIGTMEDPFVWENGERLDVLDADGVKKVGVAVLDGGAGQKKGTFTVKTDLEEGQQVVIRRASRELSGSQTQDIHSPSTARYQFGQTEKLKLDGTWATNFQMTQNYSVLEVRFSAMQGSSYHGATVKSITITGEGICGDPEGVRNNSVTVTFSSPVTLSDKQMACPVVVLPGNLRGKDCSVRFEGDGVNVSFDFKGRDIPAKQTLALKVTALDGTMIPANRTLEEFTRTKVDTKQNAETTTYSSQSVLLVDGMNWMPRYTASSLDRWGGYDGVKPDEITSANPEGYWRTGKYKGRHVMVNPDGNVTILHGINGVCPDPEKEATSELSQMEYRKRFSSTTEWVTYANRILSEYSFNFYSSNPNRIRRTREFISEADQEIMRHNNAGEQLGEVALAYLLRTFSWDYYQQTGTSFNASTGSVFTLMFDPGYLDYIDKLAADAAAIYKDDKGFIGYYTDNELQFRFSSSSTPAIYLKHWLALDTSSGSPRAYKYAKEYAENFMREKYGKDPIASNVTTAMDNAFLLDICDYYYRTATEALRRHDPNHLILGSRLHGKPKTLQQVHEACAKYCDVISVNVYGTFEPNDDYFITQFKPWIKDYDKPCFVTEFYTRDATATYEGQLYGNTGEGGGWIVKGQSARGQHYQNFTRKLISYDHCIGWQWFQFTDDYRGTDGWNNKGLITPKYALYNDCLNLMRQLHWNIYQIMEYYHNPSGVKTSPAPGTESVVWE